MRLLSREKNVTEELVAYKGEMAVKQTTVEILVPFSSLRKAKKALVDTETDESFTKNIHEAAAGAGIVACAEELVDVAEHTGEDQHCEFNGLVLTAKAKEAKADAGKHYVSLCNEYHDRHEERHKRSKYYEGAR